MKTIGISLGWNCSPAIAGVSNGIRLSKSNGYLTCPFDEMVSNLPGIIECISDDFKYFTDSNYLTLIEAPFSSGGVVKGERLIHNTKYNFFFNHESPDHAGLYISQNWQGGMYHYIDNDYKLFKERYNRRIDNFRKYINSGDKIYFIVSRFSQDYTQLKKVISDFYPSLNYEIHHMNPIDSKQIVLEHYKLMRMSDEIINIEL
jgi:hypothetical protein